MEQLKMHAIDYAKANVQKVAKLFPHCVTETANGLAIDFEKLQQELSEEVMSGSEERYQFTWPGKRAAIREANSPCYLTLRPSREDSVDFDKTKNLYIEGDNLQVLKLLRESYLGKVKMIYIDPPYNTGNDFVYNDDFSQSAADYKSQSDMFDEEGNMLLQNYEVNSETTGRYHSEWLNMMYPRLKVAKDLLTEDGVIFISIDDNEVENLRKICDEIFGEGSFVAQFIWKSRQNKDNRNKTGVSIDHEYILVFSKSSDIRALKGAERNTDAYKNSDNDPRGPWTSANMVGLLSEDLRPNCHYDLINPATGINYGRPKMGWRYDKNTMGRLISENRIIWPEEPTGRPRRKTFLSEISDVCPGYSSLVGKDVYTRDATIEVEKTMGERYFDFPKPIALVKSFIEQSSNDGDIILDFFSGSATTAHATMLQNIEDCSNRKFILVQLPEKTDSKSVAYKDGFFNICEIGKERIRCAGKKIKEEAGEAAKDLDTGFRVLKLASSNMNDVYYMPQDTNLNDLFAENIKSDRTPEDLLFQVLPELNLPLSAKIETKTIAGKQVFVVEDNYLAACFDEDITDECITAIAKTQPYHFVMRESGAHTDQVLDNFDQLFKAYSKHTITHIL